MEKSDFNNDGKDSDFGKFLPEVLAGRKPIEELLLCPQFTRLFRYCLMLTRNQADAEDLYNEVSFKVSQVLLAQFHPDFSKEFGGFPAWLRRITRNHFLDDVRRRKLPIGSERPEDLLKTKDPRADVQQKAEDDESREILVKCIESQSREVRLAAEFYVLLGYSSADTVTELAKLDIHITPPTVRNWVRDALRPFFPDALGFSDTELARIENRRRSQAKALKTASRDQETKPARKENRPAKRRPALQDPKALKSPETGSKGVKKKRADEG